VPPAESDAADRDQGQGEQAEDNAGRQQRATQCGQVRYLSGGLDVRGDAGGSVGVGQNHGEVAVGHLPVQRGAIGPVAEANQKSCAAGTVTRRVAPAVRL
jgi:hypothetical protein